MKIHAIAVAALLLGSPAFGQILTDPTAGISHAHVGNCDWSYNGTRTGDFNQKEVPVEGKKNEWTQKRVRYLRAGTGACWSGQHQEACPCSFEDLEEVEVWYERTVKEVEFSYVESVLVEADVPDLPLDGDKILEGAIEAARLAIALVKKTKTRKVYGPWSPLPPVHNFKDICECAKDPKKPGETPTSGGFGGFPNPGRGRGAPALPTTPGATTPPPFTPRGPNTVGGSDVPVPGTGPTTGGMPSVDQDDLPATPRCKAGNDIPTGRFKWDYKRVNEWAQTPTPTYLEFGAAPLCNVETKQDRYKWIKRVTMTGTLKGTASCGAKPLGHDGHPECEAGCDLDAYPTEYTVSWFRTLTFEPVIGKIHCVTGLPKPLPQIGTLKRTITGTIGWKPVFGEWDIEIGSGTSGEGASCNCVEDEEEEEEEEEPDDEEPDEDDDDGSGQDDHSHDHGH